MASTSSGSDPTVEEQNSDACAIVQAIEQIGSQWRLIILHELADGEQRFNELKRSTGASSRTLSRVLDDLQDARLVNRRVEDNPLATYYSLTAKGVGLCPVFAELEGWSEKWL